ncbi:uncharacterized protein K02A2.6 [Trichonephila clavipes]|nr:uncharacterized protein K02A2.6 [Trichonephila clavipes]
MKKIETSRKISLFCEACPEISNIKTYFWTDSSTVLTWIIRRDQWSVFDANRISEIRKLTTSEDWFHISTDQNPADILSRGCGSKQFQKRKWWQGPDWLKNSKEQWPKSAVNINEKEVEIEKRKSVISANNAEVESISSQLARRFSRFSKMIRVMAWILRFQPKAKDLRKCAELKNEELLNAQKIIFRLIQKECYSNEETRKSLKGLLIFEDEEGILRLKSRLINEEESKDFISPIILPSKHLAVRRFIAQEHLVNKHAGTLTLLIILRERFWIVKGKRTVRSVIKECLTCKRQKIKHLEVPFPPLPKDRTEVAAVFQVSGVDLAGPLLTKSKQKAWIVLFTCAVFRAVHLELITSLSTTDFIQVMQKIELREDLKSRRGLAVSLEIICHNCEESTSTMSSKISNKCYDVNLRLTYGMRAIGKGGAAARIFCGLMNLPPPPAKFERHNSLFLNV